MVLSTYRHVFRPTCDLKGKSQKDKEGEGVTCVSCHAIYEVIYSSLKVTKVAFRRQGEYSIILAYGFSLCALTEPC